jgi:importin subunit alpha-6/7
LKNVDQPHSISLVQICMWCISNLCRGKPAPDRSLTDQLVYPLAGMMDSLLAAPGAEDALNDLLWALSYLSDGDLSRVEQVMATGVTSKLISLLESNNPTIQKAPVVRILGNFVSGNDSQTDFVLQAGLLDCILDLIEHPSSSIRREACWVMSNVCGGTRKQAAQVFRRKAVITALLQKATSDIWTVRKEAIWAVSSICDGNDRRSLVVPFLLAGGLEPLVRALDARNADVGLLKKVLSCIESILRYGMASTECGYTYLLEEIGGIDLIEGLQEHENDDIYKLAVGIIEKYVGVEEDENMTPITNLDTGTYEFGNPSPKQLFANDESPSPETFTAGGMSTHNHKHPRF